MNITPNPFKDQLMHCLDTIINYEGLLAEKKKLKNDLFAKMEEFYTSKLKDIFFMQKNGRLGQISHVFAKKESLFVHVYFLEVTGNSKVIKKFSNIELFSSEMEDLLPLSNSEYKEMFFDFVNRQIRNQEAESARNGDQYE